MERKTLKGGRVIEGGYDNSARILEIVFSDLSVKQFKAVPHEVWKRLLAAPNAGTFYEDRIQDEYPSSPMPKLSAKPVEHALSNASAPKDEAQAKLEALFGKKT